MKSILSISACVSLLTIQAFSQAAPAPTPAPAAGASVAPQLAPAILIFSDKPPENVVILGASKTQIRYKLNANAIDAKDMNVSACESVYLLEPKAFRDGMELYQGRKYAEAKEAFINAKLMYKPTAALDNNYSTLGAFYELECLRRLGDLEGLAKALEGFRKEGLTREHQLRQLEIYVFWDAVRTKSWARLVALAEDRLKEKLPSYQRAQVAFCAAQAYEALKQPSKSLNAYNMAMVADIGSTEEIAEQSALGVLRVHKASPAVQLAIKLWGTEDENKNSTGYLHLREAGAVAALYEFTLGNGKKLPGDLASFLKYKPDVVKPEPAEKPKKEAPKKEEAPKEAPKGK